ncbi:MAG: hypothetical protein P4M09_05970 [Devosia sp.]|nr:hypothetical protein [Devosia sp.]
MLNIDWNSVATAVASAAALALLGNLWIRLSGRGSALWQRLGSVPGTRGLVVFAGLSLVIAIGAVLGLTVGLVQVNNRLSQSMDALAHYGPGPHPTSHPDENFGSTPIPMTANGDSICPGGDGTYAVGFLVADGKLSLACRPLNIPNPSRPQSKD